MRHVLDDLRPSMRVSSRICDLESVAAYSAIPQPKPSIFQILSISKESDRIVRGGTGSLTCSVKMAFVST